MLKKKEVINTLKVLNGKLVNTLKKENIISSGGGTGDFIKKHEIFLNGSIIQEKRKKIRLGDEISLDGEVYRIIEAKK